jgi:hypothetical protein
MPVVSGVDAELRAEGDAGDGEPLSEDPGADAVPGAIPHDHEVAGGVGGDGRSLLIAACVGVDAELRANRPLRPRGARKERNAPRTINHARDIASSQ